MGWVRVVVCGSVICTSTGTLSAQQSISLGDPAGRSVEGFTSIFDVAEMADGRVLLTDSRERAVAVVDFAAGSVERLEGRGQGPREYMSAFTILPLTDGGFRIYDAVQRRYLVLSGAAEVMGTETIDPPRLGAFSPPRGPDDAGGLYLDIRRIGETGGLIREAVLYRWTPDTGSVDSVGVVMSYARGQGGPGIVPMPRGDAWSYLPDGSVAVVGAEDYRVEWRGGEAGYALGDPIPHRRVRVGAREREAWMEELQAQPPAGMSRTAGGSGGRGQEIRRRFDEGRFPEFVPPFSPGWAPASSRGEIWLRNEVESGPDRTVIDVIGRDGNLARRILTPGTVRVLGFGADAVYLARTDEFDLEWLERYPYPR